MESALAAPKTFTLKLKIHCKGCETKLKKQLLSIQGVHSVVINDKLGYVTISGTIDPPTIISMLEKYGRKAELLREHTPSRDGDESLQIIAESKVMDQLDDPKMVEQFQQLSVIKDLKKVEVTYSKTITLTFNGQKIDRKGCVLPTEPAPSWPINSPSAPPLPSVYNSSPSPPPPPPPQPQPLPYSSIFSDENANGCVIM